MRLCVFLCHTSFEVDMFNRLQTRPMSAYVWYCEGNYVLLESKPVTKETE